MFNFLLPLISINLLEQAKRELNGPVIYYECQRFWESTAPASGNKLHPKLGEDVLVEAMLLSQCDFFVHTIYALIDSGIIFQSRFKA